VAHIVSRSRRLGGHGVAPVTPDPQRCPNLLRVVRCRTHSGMEMEIILPEEIAIMTLPEVAFFPQALLPLHIFETRYQHMLKDVLASDRLFAVTGLKPTHQ